MLLHQQLVEQWGGVSREVQEYLEVTSFSVHKTKITNVAKYTFSFVASNAKGGRTLFFH
jgi:hypothetical protein